MLQVPVALPWNVPSLASSSGFRAQTPPCQATVDVTGSKGSGDSQGGRRAMKVRYSLLLSSPAPSGRGRHLPTSHSTPSNRFGPHEVNVTVPKLRSYVSAHRRVTPSMGCNFFPARHNAVFVKAGRQCLLEIVGLTLASRPRTRPDPAPVPTSHPSRPRTRLHPLTDLAQPVVMASVSVHAVLAPFSF